MFISDMTMSQIAPQRSVSFVADQVAKWWSCASDGMVIPTAWPNPPPIMVGMQREEISQETLITAGSSCKTAGNNFYDNLRKSLVRMNSAQTCYQSKGGYLRNALFTFFAPHIQ